MNELRISGVLQAVVEHQSDGGPFLTAVLKFDREHSVLLIAAGSRVRQLAPFDARDPIVVRGRITPYKDTLAVLIDECAFWAIGKHRYSSAYAESETQKTLRDIGAL